VLDECRAGAGGRVALGLEAGRELAVGSVSLGGARSVSLPVTLRRGKGTEG
jgi:hypothetical protein